MMSFFLFFFLCIITSTEEPVADSHCLPKAKSEPLVGMSFEVKT